MFSVVTFGEIIADGFPVTSPLKEMTAPVEYTYHMGGAPVNTAAGIALLGESTAFIGRVGNDEIGIEFIHQLQKLGVNTSYITKDPNLPTSRAHVALEHGDRRFTFIPGAHATIQASEIELPQALIVHFGSILQISESAHAATQKIIRKTNEQGAILSYDPNLRLGLWDDENHARETILTTLPDVHIIKISEEEALWLTGESRIEAATEKLFIPTQHQIMIVTLAERGCFYRTTTSTEYLRTIPIQPVDTTGAGDAFNAGFLWSLLQTQTSIPNLTKEQLSVCLRFGMVTGSLTATKYGAIDAFPTYEKIDQYTSFITSGVLS